MSCSYTVFEKNNKIYRLHKPNSFQDRRVESSNYWACWRRRLYIDVSLMMYVKKNSNVSKIQVAHNLGKISFNEKNIKEEGYHVK